MTNKSHKLTDLQHWLQAVITHSGGVVEGIGSVEAQSHVPLDPAEIDSVVLPSAALTSEQRLAVYSNAYFARLLECMREFFPALRFAVDETVFDQFAIGYLTTHPPHSYTLDHLSDRFIPFLKETRNKIASAEESWPDFLIDLATLESGIEQVFDGPGTENMTLLSAADLQAIDPAAWPAARLMLAPCLKLLAFRFPVNDYYTDWRAVADDSEASLPLPDPHDSYLALTRRNYVVRRFPVDQPQHALLTALAKGKTVNESIAAAAEVCEEIDHLAVNLGKWFQEWTAAGFFVAVEVP